jgi:predicted ATPase/DNA-binding SARP family transcriptional activator
VVRWGTAAHPLPTMTAEAPASDSVVPRLLLLGRPELLGGVAPLAFVPERRYQLLALLAMHSGQWVPRDRLAAMLWPERANAEARRNLRHVVFKARDIAADLQASDHALCWDVVTDLSAFESLLGAGQRAQAIELRRGALLEGLDDAANPAFTEWLSGERMRFDARWRQASLDALAGAAPARRAELARRVQAIDRFDEDALEIQLRAEIEQGHPAHAWQLYREYAQSLAEALGVEPSHRLRDLLEREAPASATVAAAPPVPPPPEAAPTFVGRRAELAELLRLLARDDVRAITVLGPGGVGKSSLARRALQAAPEGFAGGRVWVELLDLTDLPAVLARVADQLGVPINDAQDPVLQIGRRLGSERVLCVLDNAEHLVGLPALIERLLAAAPALTLLVTSRVRLGHAGEHPLALSGLAVPDEDSRDLEAAVAFDAVRLFEARAAVAQRNFSLARHLGAVIDIVESVGGMPLAIELAAGWVRLLPAEEIAHDLRRSMDLLARDPASPEAPARPEHDSARAVLEHSWSLLAPRERAALAALAVFQGGFTRAAALAVTQASLPLLSSLVDKSLLALDDIGRFGLHPLVAAFAFERLAADRARADELTRQHAAYYALHLADLAARAGADHRPLTEGIESEYSNCRAAWCHGLALGATEWLAQSAGAWRNYFEVRGRAGEGIAHFRPALELSPLGPGRQSLAADVRSALSRMHYLRGEHQTGLAIAVSGAELAEQCGDRRALYRCLANAGSCHSAQAQWSAARPNFERALAIGSEDGLAIEVATALNNLGIVAKNEGRWDDALGHYAQALAIEREQGRHAAVVRCLSTLGGMHLSRGNWASARQCFDEGSRLSERYHIDFFVPIHACGLGEALLELGDLADAERYLLRALERSRSADNPVIAVTAEANLGRIATLRGDRAGALERLRSAARAAGERGWTNMCLHISMLLGEWLRERGAIKDAALVWRMVAAHPMADAGMRDRALGWGLALKPAPALQTREAVEPITLTAVMDWLVFAGDSSGSDPYLSRDGVLFRQNSPKPA